MVNRVIGLCVTAMAAAFLGFSAIATTFAEAARVVFFILAVLFVVTTVVALFDARRPNLKALMRMASLMAVASVVSFAACAWIEHDMAAAPVGRAIDHQAMALGDTAGGAARHASQRTAALAERVIDDIRSDAEKLVQFDASADEAVNTSTGSRQ